ncbi:MAG: DMT family transporter [Candidatus Heimdallarchaeota archaeon]|nr:DMT family transporter [Candidatus Heimdallarchaeota archaeon]MCK5049180.1 DMT family transporter [Candidatus Heimdallarchaeota archaeon]
MKIDTTSTKLGEFLLLLSAIFWGSTFVLVKGATEHMGINLFLAVRFLLGSIVLLLFTWKELKKATKRAWINGLILGIILWLTFLTQTYGIQVTSATNSALITGLYVVLVPFLSPFWTKIMPSLKMTFYAVVAFLGLVLLTVDFTTSFTVNYGDALTLVTALLVSVHIILTGIYVKEEKPLVITQIQIMTVGILSAFFALLFQETLIPKTGIPIIITAILVCALISTVFAYSVQSHFQQYVSDSRTAILYAFEPVSGVVFGVLFGDVFLITGWLGITLILIAIIKTSQEIGDLDDTSEISETSS